MCALRSTVEATLASNKAAVETMKPSVDAAKSSVENLVETVKSTVEDAVGRAVEDLQRSEAEGREDLKRSVEEASVDVPECYLGKRQCILNPKCHFSESRASRPSCFRSRISRKRCPTPASRGLPGGEMHRSWDAFRPSPCPPSRSRKSIKTLCGYCLHIDRLLFLGETSLFHCL